MKHSSYKIGIDFHGVITVSPSFFREFSELAYAHGHEIYIISGGPYIVVRNFLDTWKIRYQHIFSLIDHFSSKGQVEYFSNGNFKVPDNLWDQAKAEYCRENGIDIQIDDTASYGIYFDRPFCYYDSQRRCCEISGRHIDFNKSPRETLSSIEEFLARKH